MDTTLNTIAPFPYFGGKSRVLPWIYSTMPKSVGHLVDVFGGAGSIVLNFKSAKARTYNDVNGELVHFMRVLRDSTDELIMAIELTPHSRQEYQVAFDFEAGVSEIERARRTYVKLVQSFGRTTVKSGFSRDLNHYRYGLSESTCRILGRVPQLAFVAQELREITIENMDWAEVLDRYKGKNTFFVVDPPYLSTVRSGSVRYGKEMNGEVDHIQLVETLTEVESEGWILCCYDSKLYSDRLAPYRKHQKCNITNGGASRVETIYASHSHSLTLFEQ